MHLSKCENCMGEYKSFLRLQRKINAEGDPAPAPSRIWEKISAEFTPERKAVSIPFRPRFVKIMGIAAVLAISFISGYFVHNPVRTDINEDTPIVLASNKGEMDDTQFLTLTRELLTADPEYHQRMYFILHTLNADYWEGSFEEYEGEDLTPSIRSVSADNGENQDIYKF